MGPDELVPDEQEHCAAEVMRPEDLARGSRWSDTLLRAAPLIPGGVGSGLNT